MPAGLMRLVAVAIGIVVLATAASAPATPAQTVSLTVLRTLDNPTRTFKLRFSGAISSGAGGEDVTVLQTICGYSFGTAVAGARTRSGGFWEAEPASAAVIAPSAVYRARWRNETSAPVEIRPQIPVYLVPIGRGRLHFSLSTGTVYQAMNGRAVVLERQRGKRWTGVQTRRLAFDGGPSGSYVTRFVVPRGWVVRVRVPAKTAGPCFKPNTTERAVIG